jgi:toxin CcdB
MTQFSVHKNANPDTKSTVPYLLNVQSDLIEDLATRVVAPLYSVAAMKGKILETLTPVFEIEGKQYVMVTPQLVELAHDNITSVVIHDLDVFDT